MSSFKPKLIEVLVGIFFPNPKDVLRQLIQSLILADNSHRDDLRHLLAIFHAKNYLLFMYSPRNTLSEIDRIKIQDKQLSNAGVEWLGLWLLKGRRLLVEESVCDLA